MFLGFANFYRRFIYAYLYVAKGLIDLLKGRDKARRAFIWTKEAIEAFNKLKTAFTTVLILYHFDLALRILIETNALGFIVIGIIS